MPGCGSLAGRRVASASLGEALGLPCVYVADPLPAGLGRWPDARVIGSVAVTQRVDVCAVQFDPCPSLLGAPDRPVTGDDDGDVVGYAFEQPQPDEVCLLYTSPSPRD